jgi:CRP-like cAMP-binding protein
MRIVIGDSADTKSTIGFAVVQRYVNPLTNNYANLPRQNPELSIRQILNHARDCRDLMLVAQIEGTQMPVTLSAARSEYGPNSRPAKLFAVDPSSGSQPSAPLTLNDHLKALQQFSSRQHFTRNETIFSEGEAADRVYKIISGTVRMCQHTPDGRRYIIDFLLPGDLIGLLECAHQPATAEAVTEATLLSYPRSGVDRLAALNPTIRSRVLCHLSANLLEAQQHLFVLGCQNAKERIASFLLRLAERMDVLAGDRLELAMGRQDIADHLGLTIETVCRAITALRSNGIVGVPNSHQLILSDTRALRALAIEG